MQYFPYDATYPTLEKLYDEALSVIQDSVMCDGISIFELSADGRSLKFVATRTFARDLLKGLTLDVGTGLVGRAAAQARGVISNRVASHPDFFALPDQELRFKTHAVLCCPMRHAGAVVGVIELVNKVDRQDFTDQELDSAQAVADGAAANWHHNAATARRDVFYELTRMLRKIVDVEGVSLFTLDEAAEGSLPLRRNLVLRFCDTTRKTDLQGVQLSVDCGVAGAVVRERRAMLVPDVQLEERFFEGFDAINLFSSHSIVAAPVLDGEYLLAVLELVNARGSESFTENDMEVLERIAAELGVRRRRWSMARPAEGAP